MKTLFLSFLIASASLFAAEPTEIAPLLKQRPNLRKLEPAAIATMRHDVPFADSVYEDPSVNKGFKRWLIVDEGKIIAYYFEIITTLTQEKANRVVDADLRSRGYEMISSGGGFLGRGHELPAGKEKFFYLYGAGVIYDEARSKYDEEQRLAEEVEAGRIKKFLQAEQGGADQPTTARELKSEGKDKPQPESKVAPR
jgi:hypothetical protein